MVCVCVVDVMNVVFYVCIMRRGAVGARVSSCRCCIFVSCVAVLNAAFCMTCRLLMLVVVRLSVHVHCNLGLSPRDRCVPGQRPSVCSMGLTVSV